MFKLVIRSDSKYFLEKIGELARAIGWMIKVGDVSEVDADYDINEYGLEDENV